MSSIHKQILLDIQAHLKNSVPEIMYLDKDWGQLSYENPAVNWPCVLLDIENVDYSQQAHGGFVADTQITVTVADARYASSSANAPDKEDAYRVMDLMDKIHRELQLFSAGDYSPLFRSRLQKAYVDSFREVYKMTYQTAYMEALQDDGCRQEHLPESVHIAIEPSM
jgi:hypothetical protein